MKITTSLCILHRLIVIFIVRVQVSYIFSRDDPNDNGETPTLFLNIQIWKLKNQKSRYSKTKLKLPIYEGHLESS